MMSNRMKKFFQPLREEYNNKNNKVTLVGALIIFPAVMLGRKVGSIWVLFGIVLLWWIIVVFTYLSYRYYKSK